MFYYFDLNNFPMIYAHYSVSRNTIWQTADDYNILIFITEGCCCITYNNNDYRLEAGDVFFVPAKHHYTRRPIDGTLCTMQYVHFTLSSEINHADIHEIQSHIDDEQKMLNIDIASGISLVYPSTIYMANKISLSDFDKIKRTLDGIDMFSAKRNLTSGLQSQINLCDILLKISKKTIESAFSDASLNGSPSFPQKLQKAISYIVNHSNEQISLEDMVNHCHISKQQLARYFKNAFGQTPINYITEYKLSRAKELLWHQPDLTVNEISAELGFSNPYYFTRVFTKKTGETPTEFRRRILANGKNTFYKF